MAVGYEFINYNNTRKYELASKWTVLVTLYEEEWRLHYGLHDRVTICRTRRYR